MSHSLLQLAIFKLNIFMTNQISNLKTFKVESIYDINVEVGKIIQIMLNLLCSILSNMKNTNFKYFVEFIIRLIVYEKLNY